jgi:hypothetical protein
MEAHKKNCGVFGAVHVGQNAGRAAMRAEQAEKRGTKGGRGSVAV